VPTPNIGVASPASQNGRLEPQNQRVNPAPANTGGGHAW